MTGHRSYRSLIGDAVDAEYEQLRSVVVSEEKALKVSVQLCGLFTWDSENTRGATGSRQIRLALHRFSASSALFCPGDS
jgi:hypothetical protein